MPVGYWCPVLHAHLPYVRHPEYPEFLEEDWFFEALTETYVPLIRVLDGLLGDGVEYRLTMTLSPPLLSMMQDDLLVGRYHRYLDRLVELSHREIERTQRVDSRFTDVARFYAHEFSDIRRIFRGRLRLGHRARLPQASRRGQARDHHLRRDARLPAAHGRPCPRPCARRSQVAVQHYRRHFGRGPAGIWLPECGYYPGVDDVSSPTPASATSSSTRTACSTRTPRPRYGVYAPVSMPGRRRRLRARHRVVEAGVERRIGATRATTTTASSTATSASTSPSTTSADILPDGHPEATSASSTTGSPARSTCAQAALRSGPGPARRPPSTPGNFMFNREKQVEHLAGAHGPAARWSSRPTTPSSSATGGSRGPTSSTSCSARCTTTRTGEGRHAPEYLEVEPELDVVAAARSAPGARRGYGEVWLEGSNDWIYRHLHEAAERMVELARGYEHRRRS